MLLVAAGVAACAAPVGVRQVNERSVQRTLTSNVLSTGEPSSESRQVLLRLGLEDRYARDPEGALAELHARTIGELDPRQLFALAEYTFLHAMRRRSRPYFVAASLYAYAYLFPDDPARAPDPFDPRLRTAADLYNRAIAAALVSDAGKVAFRAGDYPFQLGVLELQIDRTGFSWGGRELTDFVPAADLEIYGLRNRYRHAGIGAPFVATVEAPAPDGKEAEDAATTRVLPRIRVPVTFFLRYEDPDVALRTGSVRARLELYAEAVSNEIEVAGREVPLEYETTTALAYGLQRSTLWDFEIAGFLHGDLLRAEDALFMMRPYVPGRIPVVLVHGTASSPARWAEMLNELESDPRIEQRYQFWFFIYTSGNPILYSASLLRESLRSAVAELDPRGRDSALRRMVLIGHSQGGLLVKLQVIDPGTRFWDNVSDRPFDEVELKPETRELLSKALFFEPLPFVDEVIFIATPHRGSFLAGNWLGRIASNLFTAPSKLVGTGVDMARAGIGAAGSAIDAARAKVDAMRGEEDAEILHEMARIPSSVDNMKPGSRFIETLSSIPIPERVAAHSIIPVTGTQLPPEGQNDGVVEYESAHIDEAVSEYVVYGSEHSTQSNPATIQEVRRILLEHLRAAE